MKAWSDDLLEIIDTRLSSERRVIYVRGLTDVNILNHHGDIIVILSLIREDAHQSYWNHEARLLFRF